MGADNPRPSFISPEPRTKTLFPVIITGMLFLIVCALKWSDVIEYINGEPRLTTKHQ
mgnify:FL=1